jgi:hypothetical protein
MSNDTSSNPSDGASEFAGESFTTTIIWCLERSNILYNWQGVSDKYLETILFIV